MKTLLLTTALLIGSQAGALTTGLYKTQSNRYCDLQVSVGEQKRPEWPNQIVNIATLIPVHTKGKVCDDFGSDDYVEMTTGKFCQIKNRRNCFFATEAAFTFEGSQNAYVNERIGCM